MEKFIIFMRKAGYCLFCILSGMAISFCVVCLVLAAVFSILWATNLH